jgi:hypothetical protein
VNLADLDALADLDPPTWTGMERQAAKPQEPRELQFAYVRTFRGADGQTVLADLQMLTLGRALPASASDTERSYLEGQRELVLRILNMINRGSRGEEG